MKTIQIKSVLNFLIIVTLYVHAKVELAMSKIVNNEA